MKKNRKIIILIGIVMIALIIILCVILKLKNNIVNNDDISKDNNFTYIDENGVEDAQVFDYPYNEADAKGNVNYQDYVGTSMIIPQNASDFFSKANPEQVGENNFGQELYTFIYSNIDKIYDKTKDLSDEEIINYYDDNYEEIQEMNIWTAIDYYMIAKDIKNLKQNGNLEYESAVADQNSYTEDDYYFSFNTVITFSNNSTLTLKSSINKDANEIKFGEGLAELENEFVFYSGKVTETDFDIYLNNLIKTYIPEIKEMAEKKSENQILQQYDQKTDTINSYGIYDATTYQNFANKVITTRWSKGATISKVEVSDDGFIDDGTYESLDVTLNYSTENKINFKLFVSDKNETTPKFKITCSE